MSTPFRTNVWRCPKCGTRLRVHLKGVALTGDIHVLTEPLHLVAICIRCRIGEQSRWVAEVRPEDFGVENGK